MMMTVNDILRHKGTEVFTIDAAISVGTAMRLLVERGVGALVVAGEDLHIAGIISERDIVRLVAGRGPAALEDPVFQVMTRRVVTCRRHDTVSDIMEVMTRGKFRHVPVVDHADRLIGIVSIGDAVKARLSHLEHEHHALREYIATA